MDDDALEWKQFTIIDDVVAILNYVVTAVPAAAGATGMLSRLKAKVEMVRVEMFPPDPAILAERQKVAEGAEVEALAQQKVAAVLGVQPHPNMVVASHDVTNSDVDAALAEHSEATQVAAAAQAELAQRTAEEAAAKAKDDADRAARIDAAATDRAREILSASGPQPDHDPRGDPLPGTPVPDLTEHRPETPATPPFLPTPDPVHAE